MSDPSSSPTLRFLRDFATMPPVAPRVAVPASVLVVTAAIAFALLAAGAPDALRDADSLWHVVIGGWILDNRAFPTVDQWSSTAAGTPWIAKEWLSQVIFAGTHRLAGWGGVTAVTDAFVCASVIVLAKEAFSRLPWMVAALLLAIVYMLISGQILARPHALAWLPLMVWMLGLVHAAEEVRRPRWTLIPVMILWANLHGSFLFGLAVVPIVAIEALLRVAPEGRRRLALEWGAFLAAATVSTVIHPYGIGVWRAAFSVMGIEGLQSAISEWLPQDFAGFNPLEAVLLPSIGLLAAAGMRIRPMRLLLVLLLLHMSLAHLRHTALLTLIGTLLLVEPIAERIGEAPAPLVPVPLPRLVAAVVLAAGALVSFALRPIAPAANITPAAALAAAREAGVDGDVVNDYSFGGFLISKGVHTWIDGRTELFGGERLTLYRNAVGLRKLENFDEVFGDPRVGWTLLAPADVAVQMLDRTPGWRRIHTDEWAVVHVRVH